MKKILASLVLFSCLTPLAAAQGRWSFDVDCGKLKPVSLQVGTNKFETWWYVVMTVTNKTGADRSLNLLARAETETKKAVNAVFRPMVRKAIEKHEKTKLTNLVSLRGTLEDGKSVKTVIILQDLDKLADRITIRVQGLSAYLYREGLQVWKEIREYVIPMVRRGDEFEVHRNPVKKLRPHWRIVPGTRKKIRG